MSIFQTKGGKAAISEEINRRYNMDIILEESKVRSADIREAVNNLKEINIKTLVPVIGLVYDYEVKTKGISLVEQMEIDIGRLVNEGKIKEAINKQKILLRDYEEEKLNER